MKSIILFGVSLMMAIYIQAQNNQTLHQFSALPYAYDALEPYIDAQTMETHYEKHHRGYYNNFLKAIQGTELEKTDILTIFANISQQNTYIRNQGGGYWNHTFYWESMTPGGKKIPEGKFNQQLLKTFGTMENFEIKFKEAALSIFGSGWAWLILDSEQNLKIVTSANQDNPYMDIASDRGIPILGIDVWEHAYYLKYKNKRGDYVSNFLKVVDWEKVSTRYNSAVAHISK